MHYCLQLSFYCQIQLLISLYLEEDLDSEHYLLQFYYAIDAGDILKLRIVEFDEMDVPLIQILLFRLYHLIHFQLSLRLLLLEL